MDRRAPRLDDETPSILEDDLRQRMERALTERHGLPLVLHGRCGPQACVLCAVTPAGRRSHEIFVFARGRGAEERATDALDGLVQQLARTGGPERGYHLPLDWEGRPWDHDVVFVRGEVRDYPAEEEAARLLEEPPPPRALDKPTVH